MSEGMGVAHLLFGATLWRNTAERTAIRYYRVISPDRGPGHCTSPNTDSYRVFRGYALFSLKPNASIDLRN
jgi:hypothetical protein